MKARLLITACPFLLCCLPCLPAQPAGAAETLREDLMQSATGESLPSEEPAHASFLDASERLLDDVRLNLNEAGPEELARLQILDEAAIGALLEYLRQAGYLESVYELQAVPGLDCLAVERLIPVVDVLPVRIAYNQLNQPVVEQQGRLALRWSRSAGQPRPEGSSPGSVPLGSPDQLFLRCRINRAGKFSAGFTAEKDPGEEFLRGSNRHGFDFYSAFLQVSRPKRRLRSVILGDFLVSMGQGLVVYQGFGAGKSAQSMAVKRPASSLKPYGSVQEAAFFRGIAIDCQLHRKWDLLVFASSRRRDANLVEASAPGDLPYISSLQYSGLHRTGAELEDRGAVRKHSAGFSARFRGRSLQLGLNQLYEQLSLPLYPSGLIHNRFAFRGSRLSNSSADYTFVFRNFHFFGEVAWSQPGRAALLNGLILTLDRKLDAVLLHRHFSRQYLALNANVFGESARGSNEQGLYLGIQAQLSRRLQASLFFDSYRHDWIRFGEESPTAGFEWLFRLTYKVKRKMELYFQLRQENKYQVAHGSGGVKTDLPGGQSLMQSRLHLVCSLSKALEWRSRVEAGFFLEPQGRQFGVMAYQELVYKELGKPFYCSARYSFFNTTDYAVRFYAFERGLSGENMILPSFGQGTKFYINAGLQLGKRWRVEGRVARTTRSSPAGLQDGIRQRLELPENELKLQANCEF